MTENDVADYAKFALRWLRANQPEMATIPDWLAVEMFKAGMGEAWKTLAERVDRMVDEAEDVSAVKFLWPIIRSPNMPKLSG